MSKQAPNSTTEVIQASLKKLLENRTALIIAHRIATFTEDRAP